MDKKLIKFSDEELLRELIERNIPSSLGDGIVKIKFPDGESRTMLDNCSEFFVGIGKDEFCSFIIYDSAVKCLKERSWKGGHFPSRKSVYIDDIEG